VNASQAVRCFVATASAMCATAASADLDALDRVPVPPGASREVVALDLVQNGQRVSIAALDTSASADDLIDFYRGAWSEAFASRPGYVEGEIGDWRLISRLEDAENQVVQLRDGEDGVEAIVSVLALEKTSATPVLYPVPDGGETLSTTTSTDTGVGTATTTVVRALQRAGETATFYRDVLRRDGWTAVSDRDDTGPHVLLLKRRGVRLELVVTDIDGGGSVAVFNRVEDA